MIGYIWKLSLAGGGNIGDYSIIPGMVQLLEENYPDYRITAVHHKVADIPGELTIQNTLPGFPGCDVIDNALEEAYFTVLDKITKEHGALPDIDYQNIDLIFEQLAPMIAKEMQQSHARFWTILKETRMVIYTSGMILVYGEGTLARENFWGYSVRRSLILLIARELGIPYGVYAHSFDSFGEADGPGIPYFKQLLEDASFVFCRDSDSAGYLRQLDIKARHLMFVPDSTVSYLHRDDEWAELFMTRNGLESRQFLVVIPRTWKGGGMISPTIGEERSRIHMEKLRNIIQRWVQETGLKVVIGAEVSRDLPNARALVYDLLPRDIQKRCICLESFWSTEQAIALYRHSRIVVTMELHSFLMAIPQGTPVVVPTFRETGRKIKMVDDFKVSDWLFDIDQNSATQIGQTVLQIHSEYDKQNKRLREVVIPSMHKKEKRALRIIKKYL